MGRRTAIGSSPSTGELEPGKGAPCHRAKTEDRLITCPALDLLDSQPRAYRYVPLTCPEERFFLSGTFAKMCGGLEIDYVCSR